MLRSVSVPLATVDCNAPSSSSSSRSSRSSTGNHSPPPLCSGTDKLILRIKHFLDNDDYYGSNDLIISATPFEFAAFRHELKAPSTLRASQVPDIRYSWNRETNLLTISCMPGSVHNALVPYLGDFKEGIQSSQPTMTTAERRAIMFTPGSDVALFRNPPSSIINGHGKHSSGIFKAPDAAFTFMGGRGASRTGFPRIVFEVAFSQSYESVLEDARQWLVRSHGAIKLCVIVKLEEQPTNFTEIDQSELQPKLDEQRRIREWFADQEPIVHEETGQDDVASPDGCTTASISSLDDERMNTVAGRLQFLHSSEEHAAWVGPLAGFMEFYRLSEDRNGIVRDGQRFDIFDPTGPDPVLHISDFLPAEAIEGDPTRAYPLLLADYRRYLDIGVEEMALGRKMRAGMAERMGEMQDSEFMYEAEKSDEEESIGSGDSDGGVQAES